MNTMDFEEKTSALNDTEKARLLLCMVRYENTGEEMELPGNERFLWPAFRLEIDREKEAAARDEAEHRKKADRAKKAAEIRWGGNPCSSAFADDATACARMQTDADACADMQTDADACTGMQTDAEAQAGIFHASENEKEKGTQKEKENGRGEDTEAPPKPPENAAFAAFWEMYPRKDGKKDAVRAWTKLNPSAEIAGRIMEALARQRASPQWNKDDGQFIPLPASWINGRRWEDQGITVQLRPPQKTVSAQQYHQREYTEEFLDSLDCDIDAEVRKMRDAKDKAVI